MAGPIRLTRRRAAALLAVFEIGAKEERLVLKSALGDMEYADDAVALRERDHRLAAATDAAQIVAARYMGGEEPLEPTPTLFDLKETS